MTTEPSSAILSPPVGSEQLTAMSDARAAIYARTSSVNQRFGYSLEEQVRQCWERAESVDWEVTHVFRDQAKSGKDEDRPMYQQMLRVAETDGFDVIVFWKLDRLSRSIMHIVQLEANLRELDIALHSVTELLDTTTPTGRFNFRNIANAAELEREMITQRSQMGMKALAMDYKWPNDHPPLGYDKDDSGRLTVSDSEASWVERIHRLYLDLASMPEVAAELNGIGFTTKRGNEWFPRAVGDVLRNELYIGQYSVAGVEEYVPEYRILETDLFEEVTTLRNRFRNGGGNSRDPMSPKRKSQKVDNVVKQYNSYVDDNYSDCL